MEAVSVYVTLSSDVLDYLISSGVIPIELFPLEQ